MQLVILALAVQSTPAPPPISRGLCAVVGRDLTAWGESAAAGLKSPDWAANALPAQQVKLARWYGAAMRDRFGRPGPLETADAGGLSVDAKIEYARACEKGGV